MDESPTFDAVTTCSHCDIRLAVPTEWFGDDVRCPECESVFSFQSISSGSSEQRASKLVDGDKSEEHQTRADFDEPGAAAKPTGKQSKAFPRLIGRYEASRRLGQGGFGVVFAAEDPILRREVAVKLPYYGDKSERMRQNNSVHARFEKEARAAAKLRHPNIVAVFDHGRSDLGVFIVYEFIPGKTLEEVLEDDGMAREEGIRLIATLADALHYASEQGIIHRDIKPANVMIDASGRPQLMDFGLAEAASDGKALTGGKIAGTPIYMSPEQARGAKQITAATDQYSLCGILYEILTRKRPVGSRGMAAVAEVAQGEGPDLEPLRPLPLDLRKIVEKGMQPDPAERYADCGQLAEDLRAYLRGYPVIANPPSPPRRLMKWAQRNRSVAVMLATVAVLLVAITLASSAAAFVFQAQRTALKSALADAEQAEKEANENAAFAEDQRKEAENQQRIAETLQKKAEALQKAAEASEQEALDALAEKDRAQRMADEEKQGKQVALAERDKVRGELAVVSEDRRELQYAEFLAKASGQISQNRLSSAMSTLNRCAEQDRGWEWHWLHRNCMKRRDYEPTKIVRQDVASRFMVPTAIANRFGIEYYDVRVEGVREADPSDIMGRIQMSPDRSLGVFVRSEPVAPSLANRQSEYSSIEYLRMIDFQTGTFLDVCTEVSPEDPIKFIGSEMVALVADRRMPTQQAGSYAKRFHEIWSVSGAAERVLQLDASAEEWSPSFIHLPERDVIVGASRSTLTSWSVGSGEVVQQVALKFAVASGPDAIIRLRDGRIAIRDAAGRVHFVDPINWKQRSSAQWEPQPREQKRALWDASGRYIALSSPDVMRQQILDKDQKPNFARNWYLVNVDTGQTVATLPMPMTPPAIVQGTIKEQSRELKARFFQCEALPIVQVEVADGGELISILDSRGGIWTWKRSPRVGTEVHELPLPESIVLAERDDDYVVATDGVEVKHVRLNGELRARKLRRSRGGKVLAIAVDSVADMIGLLDEDGYLSVYQHGRRSFETSIPGAVGLVFARRGAVAVVSTNRGTLAFVDTQTEMARETQAHNGAVTGLSYLAGIQAIVSTGDDATVRMFDPGSGSRIPADEFFLVEPAIRLSHSLPGDRLIACSGRSVTVLQLSKTEITRTYTAQLGHDVRDATMIDGGLRLLVSGRRSSTILDTETGRRLYSLPQRLTDICDIVSEGGDPWFLLGDSTSICLRAGIEK